MPIDAIEAARAYKATKVGSEMGWHGLTCKPSECKTNRIRYSGKKGYSQAGFNLAAQHAES